MEGARSNCLRRGSRRTWLIAAVVARVAVRDLSIGEPSPEDVVRTLYTG
jgi:ABC-type uncharacterized transport system ATPase subunit